MEKSAAAGIFNKYAKEYQERFMDTSIYHESFNIFCESITLRNASVLELACGPGNITRYILNKRPDFRVTATDLAPNMLELARSNNPTAEVLLMDCRKMISIEKKFDSIMCGFCLPYLDMNETMKLIADSAAMMNAGGVIYISTMEDDYSKSGYRKGSQGDEIFMHFYTADFLIDTLNQNGFEVIEVQRKVTFDTNDQMTTDLILIAKLKKHAS